MSDRKTGSGSGSYQMRYVSAQQDHINMLLKQMGASVRHINGLICFVQFDLRGTELLYVCNLNADDQFYLQRVKPYPMSAGVFPSVLNIVEYIEKDVAIFRNAMNSGQFNKFVDASRRLTALVQGLEDAFMRYNIPEKYFQESMKDLSSLEELLAEIKREAKPLEPKA